jgi:hypothetical protein
MCYPEPLSVKQGGRLYVSEYPEIPNLSLLEMPRPLPLMPLEPESFRFNQKHRGQVARL